MKVLVILAHPDKKSLNYSIAHTVIDELKTRNHEVLFHDLYGESFDPLLPESELQGDASLNEPVLTHCRELSEADGIVIVHPNWWGQPPAILKGWVDRVFRAGVAYEFLEGDKGEGVPNGLLKAEQAVVFNTSNTEADREEMAFGDPLERIWKDCIFDLCGVRNFYRKMFRIVITSTGQERQDWLNEVRETIRELFP